MAISDEIIERVRERASLVDLVSEFTQVRRSGQRFLALCPFHSEKTPSFSINEEDGLYHCFGCHKKGSIFDFVMETKGFTFPESVRFLARRVGVDIPEDSSVGRRYHKTEKTRLYLMREVLEAAVSVYSEVLNSEPIGEPGRDYLRRRGISERMVELYRLGFAPRSWSFIQERVKRKFELNSSGGLSVEQLDVLLQELGLLKRSVREGMGEDLEEMGKTEDGGNGEVSSKVERVYDAFRGRLIYPVLRSDGIPIAIGGRTVFRSDESPKYINSCESPLYQKRRTLFGVAQALNAIRRSRHAFLVEGYMDVLSLVQAGFAEVLATCGTAVTGEHVRTLKRLANRVTVVFDGDAAGMKAAASCFEVFLNSGIEVKAVMLPQGEDPDSLVRNQGAQAFEALARSDCRPAVDVFVEHCLHEEQGLVEDSLAANARSAERCARVLAKVENPVEQELLERRVAERLGVSAEAVASLVRRRRQRRLVGVASEEPRPENIELPEKRIRYREKARTDVWHDPLDDTAEKQSGAEFAGRGESRAVTGKALEVYIKQLVVAVLCEPKLCATFLKLPLFHETLGEAEFFDSGIRKLIEGIRDSDFPGIKEATNGQVEELAAIFRKAGFESEVLIEEARKQLKVGGSRPEDVIGEAERVAERCSLAQQVDKIRLEESKESDVNRLETLAQQKLAKRRSLEQLRVSGKRGV